ncbi:hypothetical protein IWX49DRAFT_639779 [Phyllosticta citricarpa]
MDSPTSDQAALMRFAFLATMQIVYPVLMRRCCGGSPWVDCLRGLFGCVCEEEILSSLNHASYSSKEHHNQGVPLLSNASAAIAARVTHHSAGAPAAVSQSGLRASSSSTFEQARWLREMEASGQQHARTRSPAPIPTPMAAKSKNTTDGGRRDSMRCDANAIRRVECGEAEGASCRDLRPHARHFAPIIPSRTLICAIAYLLGLKVNEAGGGAPVVVVVVAHVETGSQDPIPESEVGCSAGSSGSPTDDTWPDEEGHGFGATALCKWVVQRRAKDGRHLARQHQTTFSPFANFHF